MTFSAARRHSRSPSDLWVVLIAVGIAIIAVGMVVGIADAVRESDRLVRTDNRIIGVLIDHRTPWLTDLAKVVTELGSALVVAPITLVTVALLLRVRKVHVALVVALSNIGVVVLVAATKHFVGRARPPAVDRLVSAHGLAFPSGHSAQSVACYGALAWLASTLSRTRRVRVLSIVAATILVVGVGSSRVYLGVHWPSDVLSGWLLGLGWLAALVGAAHVVWGDIRGPTS